MNGSPGDQVSILDRGLQFGDGLFETIAVVNNQPCLWDYHMQRLQRDCRRLGIVVPDTQLLGQEARMLVADEPLAVLKITISRGISERGYKPAFPAAPTRILSLFSWDEPCSDPIKVSISPRRLGHNSELAGIKHLNRLEQVLARVECPDDVDDALMLNQQGHVIEGIMSNLLLQRGKQLFTPSLHCCGVEGVVKQLILDVARDKGIAIKTGDFSLDEVLQSDALYLTSSLTGIRFVSEIAGYDWRPEVAFHPMLRQAAIPVFN